MDKQPTPKLTFDQLPEYICELGRKVDYLTTLLAAHTTTAPDEMGGIDLATQVTRLSKDRIYALVSKRKIPHSKRGNKLTFKRLELLSWLDEGKRAERKGGLDA